jgi:very-short-patch-repair endonuclease
VWVLGVRSLVSVSGTKEQRIAQIAALQRGRIARHQLRAAGISNSTVARMIERGQLRREIHGVYAVGYCDRGLVTTQTVALLACRPGALLSHLSAAELWGLLPSATARVVEITIAGRRTGHPPGVTVHRTRRLHRTEVRTRRQLPVTSPARALLDVADRLPERMLERAIDTGIEHNVVRLSEIQAVITRNPGRHATTILSELLGERTGSTYSRSETEERALKALREANIPQPEMNVPLFGYIADFYWRRYGVVLEVDGYRYHSTKTAFERDRRKDAVFTANGLDVVRVSRDQIVHETLMVIALLATAIAHAETRMSRWRTGS